MKEITKYHISATEYSFTAFCCWTVIAGRRRAVFNDAYKLKLYNVLYDGMILMNWRTGHTEANKTGMVSVLQAEAQFCFSLQHGYHSNPTTPKLQHTSNQEQYDQCGNSTE